jgi:hypothetical protein
MWVGPGADDELPQEQVGGGASAQQVGGNEGGEVQGGPGGGGALQHGRIVKRTRPRGEGLKDPHNTVQGPEGA